MKRSRILILSLVALVAGALLGPASNAMAAGSITGAGSTLLAPLEAYWAADYHTKAGVSVTYGAVGSGAGIAQVSARTVDFGASDAPLTPAQAGNCNNCVQMPWGLTATGIAFHLDGVRRLRLSGPVIALIYRGQIKKWNDKRIKKLNRGVKLPSTTITPVFRSDGSGDTYAFTDFLSGVSAQWRKNFGRATAISFPVGVGGRGNDGVTALVASTNGSIGYISASYIIAHALKVAALQNAAGKFVYPNLSNITAAASVVKSVPANNEMHIVNPPRKLKTAYPLSTFTYVIVPHNGANKSAVASFIRYAIKGGQQFGAALDFAPIPKVVYNADIRTLASL
ncbi:MAG TPA: phosphate ABC transporter substrate-binding protein PstS [Conexibacter sp.]|nr:phosphate ABC transporter substrate-binding protein PstS [Conexibacter sp.]